MEYLITILVFIWGIIIGSFLNVVILRWPKEQSLTGRSKCVHCGHILSPWELVPLFSFIFLGGKCHNCHKKISPRYFLIELLTGLLFVFSWYWLNPSITFEFINFARYLFIIAICIVIFVIDLENFLILDKIIFPAAIVALIFSIILDIASKTSFLSFNSHTVSSILAAVFASLPFFAIWYFSEGKWMGFGDVKLMLFLGAALGLPLIWVNLMVAVLLGGIISVFLLSFGQKSLKSKVPFGTFLTVGSVITLFFGPQLLHWYLGLLGL